MKIRTIKERNCIEISGHGGELDTDADYRDLFQILDRKLLQGKRFSLLVRHVGDDLPLIRHRLSLVNYCRMREELLEEQVRGLAVVSQHDVDFFSVHARNSQVYTPPFPVLSARSKFDCFMWLDVIEEADDMDASEAN